MRALVQRVAARGGAVDGSGRRGDRPGPARPARRDARRRAGDRRPARRQGARPARVRGRRGPDERAARRPGRPLHLPVHALRRRAQGQPAVVRRRRRGPSTPSRSTSASATASAPQRGVFGAHMAVELVNDGPVTVLLELISRLAAAMPPVERFICRFAAEPPQERPAERRLGRRPSRPSSWPPACGSTREGEELGRARGAALVPRPHVGRAHLHPGDRPHDDRARAVRLRVLRPRPPDADGGDASRATSQAAPTSPTRPPSATRTGGSTSARRSSAAGAARTAQSPR